MLAVGCNRSAARTGYRIADVFKGACFKNFTNENLEAVLQQQAVACEVRGLQTYRRCPVRRQSPIGSPFLWRYCCNIVYRFSSNKVNPVLASEKKAKIRKYSELEKCAVIPE